MASTDIGFHNTTKIDVESRVFDTFKTIEFTFTNKEGETTAFTVYTHDFDLDINDKGERKANRLND